MAIVNWPAVKWDNQTVEGLPTLSAYWLLDPAPAEEAEKELRAKVEGALCVVGATYTGSGDTWLQPFDNTFPGLAIHASLIGTILSGRARAEAGAPALVLAVLALAALAVPASLLRSPFLAAGAAVAGGTVYLGVVFLALWKLDLHLPVFLPELALAASFAALFVHRSAAESRDAAFLRGHFASTLSPQLLDELLQNPGLVNKKGERRELTVMFTDIKGFTAISDREQPEVIQDLLGEYFEAMTEIIHQHGGAIDKFMGDGIMAFWGAPKPLPPAEAARAAVRAGVEMQKKVKVLSKKWVSEARPPIEIRIGVNTGYVAVGFFGSPQHREYTVLGSEVNLAQRLESKCVPGRVLLSKRTCALIRPEFNPQSLGPRKLKGFDDEIEVFEVEGGE
jgi:adenylate cyclase